MIHVTCPTGCPGQIPHPAKRRAEPLQCPNCRSWLKVPESADDGELVEGVPTAPEPTASDLEQPDLHRVIRVTCPTGCDGHIPRPVHVRAELMRCHNCTAWFKIPDGAIVEDLVVGLLVASPGELPAGVDESQIPELTVRPVQA
jgi:hypothetical protein